MARTKRNPELAEALNIYKSSLAHQSFIDTNAINSFNSETPQKLLTPLIVKLTMLITPLVTQRWQHPFQLLQMLIT